ncbi:uncharacterized protein Dwil_GK19127 [Drosophila willistoni]|uniref:Thioredoxin domain-containing protein n=1 Tax=Drosophila willistoni TaxID=7260 RepID=B4N3Y9_DROWI|nr:thioredoxin-related transmembrane protein 1 [Drosophila willistoni]EDW79344.1 uncharacterized protein Dwil_GK19127 [Drosophila willistoni]
MFGPFKCGFLVTIIFVVIANTVASAAGALDEIENDNKDAHGLQKISRSLVEIHENDWKKLLTGEWIVSICAKNLEDCRQSEIKVYQLATSDVYSSLNVGIAVVDLSKESTLLRRLSTYELPTLYHVIDGHFRSLDPNLEMTALRQLVEKQEWSSISEIPFWRHPTSIWTCVLVFEYKASLDLLESGTVGDDNEIATWCIYLMLTGMLAMIIWIVYICWRILFFVIHCLARNKDMATINDRKKNQNGDASKKKKK